MLFTINNIHQKILQLIYVIVAVLYVLVYISVWANGTHASLWATPEQEAQDEKNDVAILKAVFTSMEEYWLRRLTTGHR